jgi:hypothetical protein
VQTPEAIASQYTARIEAFERDLARGDRADARFAAVRVAIAILGVILLWRVGPAGMAWLFLPLALFAAVAFMHGRVIARNERTRRAIDFYRLGLARIHHDWIGKGRTGEDYRPDNHLYADDLDLFGRGSLFELLGTVRTRAGEETLAHWLLEPAGHDEARQRQEAVRELAGRLDLREAIVGLGEHVKVAIDAPLLRQWAAEPTPVASPGLRAALLVLSLLTVTSLVAWWRMELAGWIVLALIATQVAITFRLAPRVGKVDEAVDEPAHDLDVLAGLLHLIEQETFTSSCLKRLQHNLKREKAASEEIATLSRLVAMLASHRNVMFALPAALVMWRTQWALAIEAWKDRTGRGIPLWLETVGRFEALLALGGFAAEHPDYVFPTLVEGPAGISAVELAHPVLGAAAVPNDLALGAVGGPAADTAAHLLVVSGSNMSGKSTWIRTVGVAVVLARMGAPVRARALTLSPLSIGAVIAIGDSLTDGRSRFYTEVLRLKAVVDLAHARPHGVLFLLDEILSGTNSHDRRIGAEAVMRQLVEAGAIGMVTTHDLALADIAASIGPRAANAHFEDDFADGQMTFDYRLKPGVVRTSNALALMRAAGIDVAASPASAGSADRHQS